MNLKIRFIIFIVICCLFAFTSCNKKRNPIQVNCEIDNTNIKEIYWEENVIKVKGSGACPVGEEYTEAMRRLMALRAARADGFRNMADVIYQIEILDKDGKTTTIRDIASSDDVLKVNIQKYIQGSQIASEQFFPDECRYEVILQNKLNGEGGLSKIIGQEIIKKCY